MPSVETFQPQWASPPGDTIRDILRERGLDSTVLSSVVGIGSETAEAILGGQEPITLDLARKLSASLGASVQFWIARDAQYRDDLTRLDANEWMRALPLRDMYALGWLPTHTDWEDRYEACLRFFDVLDPSSWRSRYADVVSEARFRSSEQGKNNAEAIATWLRQGEITVAPIPCERWNPGRFRESLEAIRLLTRSRNPADFLPELAGVCARSGVALGVIRPPSRCSVSGASRFVDSDRAVILLSGRFLTDDHLWFTFFHEAGHLLLHDASHTYVDDLAPTAAHDDVVDFDEADANRFAQEELVPTLTLQNISADRISVRSVLSAARQLGIAPGIVVGQLQHAGLIPFQRLNGVKRRYRWNGASLEMA